MNNSIGKWSVVTGPWKNEITHKFIKHDQKLATILLAKKSHVVAWNVFDDGCNSTEHISGFMFWQGIEIDLEKAARAAWNEAQQLGAIPKDAAFQPLEEL